MVEALVSDTSILIPTVSSNLELPPARGNATESIAAKSIESIEKLIATVQTQDAEEVTSNDAMDASSPSTMISSGHFDSESTAWSLAVESKLNALIDQSKAFERERIEIESLREQLRAAIETAESRLASVSDSTKTNSDAELQLIESKQEIARLTTLLIHSRNEYQLLVEFIEQEPRQTGKNEDESETPSSLTQSILDKAEAREIELHVEISQLNDQLEFLQSELTELRSLPIQIQGDDAELRIQIEKLRSQLLDARHESVELRLQNNELSSRLVKFQGPSESQRSEALSWEQRKEALLQQLEAETHAETPCDPRKVLEIEKVIAQTNAEIDRRDREIADLRSLLEQQSFAHNGMAVGVAAVAEMIESDSMIIAERVRLQEMQQDWEQKQRQAEIEMSMERAKLARERLELQEKLRSFEESFPPQTEDEKKVGKEKNRGRWLARLGLRDE